MMMHLSILISTSVPPLNASRPVVEANNVAHNGRYFLSRVSFVKGQL